MWAAAQKHPQVVQALVERGADVRARSRVYKQTVTSEVTQRAGREELNYSVPRGGSTPLLFAARVGDAESARILLEAGADVNDALPNGTSALVAGRPQRSAGGRYPAARQGRGPERRRGRLHGAPCGGAEKRSGPGEGAAGPRRESERTDHPGHSGPAQQRGLRAAGDARSAPPPTCWPPSSSRSTSCACWRRAARIRGCR